MIYILAQWSLLKAQRSAASLCHHSDLSLVLYRCREQDGGDPFINAMTVKPASVEFSDRWCVQVKIKYLPISEQMLSLLTFTTAPTDRLIVRTCPSIPSCPFNFFFFPHHAHSDSLGLCHRLPDTVNAAYLSCMGVSGESRAHSICGPPCRIDRSAGNAHICNVASRICFALCVLSHCVKRGADW